MNIDSQLDAVNKAALHFACPRCSQRAGQWCKTSSGQRAKDLHGARTTPIYHAWCHGYEQGETDGIRMTLERPQWAESFLGRKIARGAA